MVPRAVRSARPQFITLFDLAVLLAPRARFEILINIAWMPINVSALAERLDLDIVTISICLGKFAVAGLVSCVHDGRYHIYSLGPAATAVFSEQGLVLTARSDDGQSIQWSLNSRQLAELLRSADGPLGKIGPPSPRDRVTE